MTARDEWRKHVGEACTDFRLHCVGVRRSIRYEQALFHAAVAEVLALRLQAIYAPLFGTLKRIERQCEILANSGRDQFAPPVVRPVVSPMPVFDLPEFLRSEPVSTD